MTLLHVMATLVLVAAFLLPIQASNLRNNSPIQAVSSDLDRPAVPNANDATRDVGVSHSVGDESQVIEMKRLVGDATVEEVNGIKAWAQCGGLYYVGETACQSHTLCKPLSDFISLCVPESKPTAQVVRLAL